MEVAAVNGPSSVVLSGDEGAVCAVGEVLRGRGVRVKRLVVSHAFHSARMEPMLADFVAELESVVWRDAVVPVVSNVSGRLAGVGELGGGGYWAEHVRRPVRFADGVAAAVGCGGSVFVEVGPGGVLSGVVAEVAAGVGVEVVCVAALRDGRSEERSLLGSVGELFVRGVGVDWAAVVPPVVGHVELPTYAFDRGHYWLPPGEAGTDATALGGLAGADHPMLGAVVQLPQNDGLLCTSRLSLRTHPWLADHAIGGVVLVPGTGLVELAVRAGDEVGCSVLEELVIEAPLVVPRHGGVRVQVALGGPGEHGSRTVEVYSLREDAGGDSWTRHASGVLTATARPRRDGARFDFTAWPPPGARAVDISGAYDLLAQAGFGYGPTFQAVRAVWRRGEETFAEVALPEAQRAEAGRFGLHPALLDAALHSTMLGVTAADGEPDGQSLRLPFAWNGLRLHAAGATALRVRVARPEADAMSLEAVDEAGGLVVTMDSLLGRPVSREQLDVAAAGTAHADALFRVEWTELPSAQGEPAPAWVPVADAEQVATLADDVLSGAPAPALVVLDASGAGDGADAVLERTTRVLDVVQCWLAGGGFEESRLVVATRGAVPAGDGAVSDPAGAAVWGLVRAAQAENPDRIVLVDLDPAAEGTAESVLGPALAGGEPQVAVRGTTLRVPRLVRLTAPPADGPAMFGPDATVLVTGGTGSLGGLVARHLVTRHGVRRLLLASRRGPDAEGVDALVAELTAKGAAVSVAACDLSDRDQVAALLAAVPAEHPLTGVVHTAGVSDAGVIGTVTPDRLAEVFAPKVDAVRHLDELTRGTDLTAFVVYSSVSGVFMGAGSGSYAAANAFLDGLVANRRAAGLAGLSLAWGVWEQRTGMAAHTDELTRSRMNRRGGLLPITPDEGMELFDAAVASGQVTVVPAKLDLRRLRADAAAGADVPPMLRGLVRAGRQLAHTGGATDERVPLAEQLAVLPAPERATVLLDLARAEVAAVLGYGAGHHIDADQGLFEIGFDSLTAIELRNRLRAVTGRQIAPNLVFDHPTPGMLAAYLHELLCGEQAAAPVAISV
nr:polyketide synthase [uncultured bacterium]